MLKKLSKPKGKPVGPPILLHCGDFINRNEPYKKMLKKFRKRFLVFANERAEEDFPKATKVYIGDLSVNHDANDKGYIVVTATAQLYVT